MQFVPYDKLQLMRVSAVLLFLLSSCASTPGRDPFIVVLDPGHDIKNPGTVSTKFIGENIYNDELVAAIRSELRAYSNFKVLLTRGPEQILSLRERIDVAESSQANIFISIHHDSAQEQYLEKIQSGLKQGWKTKQAIEGFSVFVSLDNKSKAESILLAKLIGSQMRKIGRKPSTHHSENIPGENRPLIDPLNGVYQYDTLAVLSKTSMPAVLLEAGVIVDPADESFVSDKEKKRNMAKAISAAILEFKNDYWAP